MTPTPTPTPDMRERLDGIINEFTSLRVLVVGDLMLDDYRIGEAERISPEAPVPVVRVRSERSELGGRFARIVIERNVETAGQHASRCKRRAHSVADALGHGLFQSSHPPLGIGRPDAPRFDSDQYGDRFTFAAHTHSPLKSPSSHQCKRFLHRIGRLGDGFFRG